MFEVSFRVRQTQDTYYADARANIQVVNRDDDVITFDKEHCVTMETNGQPCEVGVYLRFWAEKEFSYFDVTAQSQDINEGTICKKGEICSTNENSVSFRFTKDDYHERQILLIQGKDDDVADVAVAEVVHDYAHVSVRR